MYQLNVDNAQHLTIAQFLIGTETVLSMDSFLKYIIRQIEVIKFTYDWHLRSGCPGIKKFAVSSLGRLYAGLDRADYGIERAEVRILDVQIVKVKL
jgi:hypothetical protein